MSNDRFVIDGFLIHDLERDLLSPNWESIDLNSLKLNGWINLAKGIKKEGKWTDAEKKKIVARIQCLVVEAGMITNERFQERVS